MNKVAIIWKKSTARLMSFAANVFAHDTNYDINNTLLIIGSARSGTTFLMESVNKNNDYRIIFEPFNSTYTKEWAVYNSRQYFDPGEISLDDKEVLEKILSGKVKNKWIDRYNRQIRCDKRIIKAVRANLLIPAIRKISPSLPILYLTRDIKDVVASRINLGFGEELEKILDDDLFLSRYYESLDIQNLYSTLNTMAGKHAILHSLENEFLINNQENLNLTHVEYKDIAFKKIIWSKEKGIIIEKGKSSISASTSMREKYILNDKELKEIDKVVSFFNN